MQFSSATFVQFTLAANTILGRSRLRAVDVVPKQPVGAQDQGASRVEDTINRCRTKIEEPFGEGKELHGLRRFRRRRLLLSAKRNLVDRMGSRTLARVLDGEAVAPNVSYGASLCLPPRGRAWRTV